MGMSLVVQRALFLQWYSPVIAGGDRCDAEGEVVAGEPYTDTTNRCRVNDDRDILIPG